MSGCGSSSDELESAGGSSASATGGSSNPVGGAAGQSGAGTGAMGVGGGGSGGTANNVAGGGNSTQGGSASGGGSGSGGTSAVDTGGAGGAGSGGAASAQGGGGSSGSATSGGTAGSGQGGQAGQGGSGGTAGTSSGGVGGYQPCPASPCVILPLGDSITYGYGTTDSSGAVEGSPSGYRTRLFALAIADGKTLTFVGNSADGPNSVSGKTFPRQHEGHSSYTIDGSKGITQFVDSGLVSKFKPNIVLLMIGTNDMSQNLDLANAPSRLGKLMDKIYVDAPNALIVVAKITPSQKDPANTYTKTYNGGLSAVIDQRVSQGKHAVLVDMNTPFVSNTNWKKELMRDSVHPNNAGYDILSKTWYAAIKAYLR